jgi:hypothetical protein
LAQRIQLRSQSFTAAMALLQRFKAAATIAALSQQDLQLAGLAEATFLEILQGVLSYLQLSVSLPTGGRGVAEGLVQLLMQGLQFCCAGWHGLLLLQLLAALLQCIQLRLELAQALRQVTLLAFECLKVWDCRSRLGCELLLKE